MPNSWGRVKIKTGSTEGAEPKHKYLQTKEGKNWKTEMSMFCKNIEIAFAASFTWGYKKKVLAGKGFILQKVFPTPATNFIFLRCRTRKKVCSDWHTDFVENGMVLTLIEESSSKYTENRTKEIIKSWMNIKEWIHSTSQTTLWSKLKHKWAPTTTNIYHEGKPSE